MKAEPPSAAAEPIRDRADRVVCQGVVLAVWQFCAIIFATAWSYRFLIAVMTDRFHNVVRKDMVRAALSLVHTGVLGNLCLTPTGPSAIQPPGYVLVLAGIFHVFGTGAAGEAAKVILSITMSSLRCALVPFLVFQFGLGRTAVIGSGVAAALWIGALETELQGDWDAPVTAVLLMVLTWLHFAKPLGDSTPRRAAALGLLWGVATLFNPAVLTVMAGFLVVDALRTGRARIPEFVRRSAIASGCLALTLFPWALRNKVSLGEFIWTRDTMPFTLYLSYRDGAHWADAVNTRPSLGHPGRPNRDAVESPCPWVNPSESRRMAKMGEVAWLRDLDEKAKRWIRAHPAESVRLLAQHTLYFWFPPGAEFYRWRESKGMLIYSAARSLLSALAFWGCIVLLRRHREAGWYIAAILVTYPAAYYVANWSSRYRAPIEWVLVVAAAAAVAQVLHRATAGERRG